MLHSINQYIYKQLFGALFFAFLALGGMFWLGQMVPFIDQIILRGESTFTFFSIVILLIPKVIKLLLPIAALIGTIFTMNRLAIEGELMAIHNSGRNPLQILIPVGLFGLTVFAVHFIIAVWGSPASSFLMNQRLFEIRDNYARNIISAKQFVNPTDNLFIFAEESTLEGEMLSVFIDDRREEGFSRNYYAQKAVLIRDGSVSKLGLIDGQYFEQAKEDNRLSSGRFERLEIEIDIAGLKKTTHTPFLDEAPFRFLLKDQATWNEAGYKYYEENRQLGEWIDRVSYPLLSILLPLIGTIGFLGAPLSRYGYTHIIWPSATIGLAFTAFYFALNGIISGNPSLVFLPILPIIVLTLGIVFVGIRFHGEQS